MQPKLIEVIKKSFQIYKKNFFIIAGFVILNIIPGILIYLWTLLVRGPGRFLLDKSVVWGVIVLVINYIVVILGSILVFWMNIAFIKGIYKIFNNQSGEIFSSIAEAKKNLAKGIYLSILLFVKTIWPLFVSVLGLAVLFALSVGEKGDSNFLSKFFSLFYILFGLFGIYGIVHIIYYTIRYAFSLFLVVIDNNQVKQSFLNSKNLTLHCWWLIPIIYFFIAFLSVLVQFVFVRVALMGAAANFISMGLASLINLFFIYPLSMILLVVLYEQVVSFRSELT